MSWLAPPWRCSLYSGSSKISVTWFSFWYPVFSRLAASSSSYHFSYFRSWPCTKWWELTSRILKITKMWTSSSDSCYRPSKTQLETSLLLNTAFGIDNCKTTPQTSKLSSWFLWFGPSSLHSIWWFWPQSSWIAWLQLLAKAIKKLCWSQRTTASPKNWRST